jgi:hypothetical protein
MTTRPPAKLPWSVPLRPEDVPESGRHFDLVADEPTRNAIAAMAGLRALPRFTASFDVSRRGSGLTLTGEIAATVEQTCVVTLEPLSNDVREAVDVVFLPADSSPKLSSMAWRISARRRPSFCCSPSILTRASRARCSRRRRPTIPASIPSRRLRP